MKKIFYLVTLVIFSLLFVQCEKEPDGKGVHEGHEFVDLGLPSGLKWAAYNVGAESPEQSGDYFAWGEVEPKSYYFWNTYKYSGDKDSTFTKYCTDTLCGLNGFVDNKLQLDIEDDAAHVNWGGNWRMPTADELDDVRYLCTWEWTTRNGVPGLLGTSRVEGYTDRTIFFPAAGSYFGDQLTITGGITDGYYLTKSVNSTYPEVYFSSVIFVFIKEMNTIHFDMPFYRYVGASIRAVCP